MPIDEHCLQYVYAGNEGECELVIGFDFGTSASKVVIQIPDLPGSPGYAVNFCNLAHTSMPFILPTRLHRQPNNLFNLGRGNGAKNMINDIKLELFSDNDHIRSNRGPQEQGFSPEGLAAIYLALVLRYSRKWFLETRQDVLRHFGRLIWSLNLGVPSPCSEDNEDNHRFIRVGKAAWMLSTLQENRITLERAINELRMVDDSDYWETDDELSCDFAIIPEIVAGAVGYALSDLRRVGLHLMIDIGASTVDMCSFILHQADGGDRYSLLVTDVKLLGTIRLHHERIASIQHYHERRSQDLRDSHDPLMPITDDIEPYILRREEMINEIRAAEDELKAECMKMMKLIIRDAKQRDPNSSVWRTGRLPILLIGGGSQLPFFSSTVEKLDGWLREFDINEGTILMQVTVPESLLSQTDDYYRLVVAWGLSHREFDIGEVTPASRIMAVEQPPHQDWEERYIGPEQI